MYNHIGDQLLQKHPLSFMISDLNCQTNLTFEETENTAAQSEGDARVAVSQAVSGSCAAAVCHVGVRLKPV